jgi:peptidoglycan DL-endopeptidase CwlO
MRRTPRTPSLRVTATAVIALALTAAIQPPARAEPSTLAEVRAVLDQLYRSAELATDKYNAADVQVKKQQKRVRTLRTQVSTAEKKLDKLTLLAGAAARAQYRGGGLPAEVQFAFSDDPESALDDALLIRRTQQSTQDVIDGLSETRSSLRTRKEEATEVLADLKANRATKAKQRRTIEQRIADAKRIESRLAASQRQQIAAMDTRDASAAQARWESTGILSKVSKTTTAAGKKAVEFAAKQIGKPYQWGATGPNSYDCSGLTSQAWLHAGVTIPRTSEAQWAGLKRIPQSSMRPGDLVIYFSDASHVAIYMGDGKIISAPRPGRDIYISPVASMPILGVVRPDA